MGPKTKRRLVQIRPMSRTLNAIVRCGYGSHVLGNVFLVTRLVELDRVAGVSSILRGQFPLRVAFRLFTGMIEEAERLSLLNQITIHVLRP